tara:strand:- start:41 stop:163 length:123 start_codon:yes stop_codon:yes gene_type:complete
MSIRKEKVAERKGYALGFAHGMGGSMSLVLIVTWISMYLS